MKNILCVDKMYYCYHCNVRGFFCYTPSGADFQTCPCCGQNDFLNDAINRYPYPKIRMYDFLFEDEFENDMRNVYRYCSFCKIIFQLGCMHYNGGCTSNVYNCHFIKKWKHKTTNIVYEGMPLFDNYEDWFNNVNDVVVLKMHCPHNNSKCKNSVLVEEMCDL